jgi:uncharacterized protein (TIGR03382 family)
MMRVCPALIVAALAIPSTAAAHIAMTFPTPRTDSLKTGPCGASGSTRGTDVTELPPGATITVTWTEPVDHESHFRISFDEDGEDFTVPDDFMDFSKTENVLVDDILDNGPPFSQSITLPDVECDHCTLQLTQMMYDKPPYGDGNDIYYQCADVTLRAGATVPDPPAGDDDPADDPTDPDSGHSSTTTGGCSTTGSPAGIPVILGAVAALTRRRRK